MEVCAMIASTSPDLHVTVVTDGPHLLPGIMNADMSRYYEEKLTAKYGVRFARNVRVKELWETDDAGEYCTLDGPAYERAKLRSERSCEASEAPTTKPNTNPPSRS